MIPVLTQPCLDNEMIPIGVVRAHSLQQVGHSDRFDSLVEQIRAAAPAGTDALYNLQFDHDYLRGTADAFRKPVGKRCR